MWRLSPAAKAARAAAVEADISLVALVLAHLVGALPRASPLADARVGAVGGHGGRRRRRRRHGHRGIRADAVVRGAPVEPITLGSGRAADVDPSANRVTLAL